MTTSDLFDEYTDFTPRCKLNSLYRSAGALLEETSIAPLQNMQSSSLSDYPSVTYLLRMGEDSGNGFQENCKRVDFDFLN